MPTEWLKTEHQDEVEDEVETEDEDVHVTIWKRAFLPQPGEA